MLCLTSICLESKSSFCHLKEWILGHMERTIIPPSTMETCNTLSYSTKFENGKETINKK